MNAAEGARQKREILDALRKLGETLTPEEENYLKQYTESGNAGFAKMTDSTGPSFKLIAVLFFFNDKFVILGVNANALSAFAAKQIANAQGPR